jgi:hypothetical protein
VSHLCGAEADIERLSAKPEFKTLAIFTVDCDKQKDAVRGFGARMQSTLIGFKGTKETGRSVGDTEEPSIERRMRSTSSFCASVLLFLVCNDDHIIPKPRHPIWMPDFQPRDCAPDT